MFLLQIAMLSSRDDDVVVRTLLNRLLPTYEADVATGWWQASLWFWQLMSKDKIVIVFRALVARSRSLFFIARAMSARAINERQRSSTLVDRNDFTFPHLASFKCEGSEKKKIVHFDTLWCSFKSTRALERSLSTKRSDNKELWIRKGWSCEFCCKKYREKYAAPAHSTAASR